MPVRKIGKSARSLTGVLPSLKSVGDAQFESSLERDYLVILEVDCRVEKFETQPVRIRFEKRRHYTPDVLVHFFKVFGLRPLLVEVKYRSDLRENWPALHPGLRQGLHYARLHEQQFKIMSEVEIRTEFGSNAHFLYPRIVQGDENPTFCKMLLDTMARLGESTPELLVEAASDDKQLQPYLFPSLWYLIAKFQIGADLDLPLVMSSRIWSLK